jgi:ferric-dicitrate binding protein FerR (iron transport regulator)
MDINAIDIQELIIADLSGSITNEEKNRLNRLMTESRDVRDRYEHIKSELASVNTAAVRESHTSATELLEMARRRKNGRTIRMFAIAASAAAIVLILGGLPYYLRSLKVSEQIASHLNNKMMLMIGNTKIDLECKTCEINANGYVLHNSNKQLTYTGANGDQISGILTVPAGKSYNVVLDDGSVVYMNAASRMEFPMKFNGNKREITISGEAYLKVAKNADRPFIVHLNNSYVQVLGTEFNVNTYDSGAIHVSLVTGSVKLNAGQDSVILQPGKAAAYEGAAIAVNSFDEDEVLSWKSGMLKFSGITIDEIADKVIPRYFDEHVVIDPSASGKKFTGVIDRNKPLKEFLYHLTITNEITHYMKDGVIHLK